MKLRPLIMMGSLLFVVQATYADTTESTPPNLPAAELTQASNATSTNVNNNQANVNDAPATADAQPARVDPATEQTGFSQGSVVRSAFTSEINDREPIDTLTEMPNDSKVYFFTELRDMSGQTAIHRWEHNGEVKAEIEFKVGGPRWRVWSSKSFNPEWTGEWKVSVVNGANEVIKEKTLLLTASTNTNQSIKNNGAANTTATGNQIIESEVVE